MAAYELRISDWSSDVCSSDLRLEAEDGSAVDVIDFCPRFERSGRMFRPVAFVRIVRPVAGSPRVAMELVPMRDYGAEIAATTRGTNHIRYLIGPPPLRLTTDAPGGHVLESRSFDRTSVG